jgi:two-component system sensor histidine kinase NreB
MRGETTTFLESLFQNVSDGIVVVNADGIIVKVNTAFEQMSGWTSEDLISKVPLCAICRGMATCMEEASCIDCFASHLKVPAFEMKVLHKSGVEISVTASSSRLPQLDGEGALVLILRDITEQQRVERERYQQMMTRYVIQAQEDERKRISRELHDGIGQALYSIMVGLKVLNHLDLDGPIRDHLQEVQNLTVRTLQEVKHMAVELRPSALDDLGLIPALRSYCKGYESTFGIETKLIVEGGKRRYQPEVETALYRICQEAMTNAAKYADIDMITIRLIDTPESVELHVEDQGIGFEPEHVEVRGTGLGLYGIRERASLLGGEVEIESAPGRGTSVRVEIPLDERGGAKHVNPGADRG